MRQRADSRCSACKGVGYVWDTNEVFGTVPVDLTLVCPQCDGTGSNRPLGDKPPTPEQRAEGVE